MNEKLKAMLTRHEGFKMKPYRDTVGKLTIGIGHNLDDRGLSSQVIDMIFEEDMAEAEKTARQIVKSFDDLNEARQAAILDMAFNMGFKLAEFKKTIAAIEDKDFDTAANEMLRSLWAQQVGSRAQELAQIIRTGEW